MSKSGHTENITEPTLCLEEDIVEQEVPEGALEALAVRSGQEKIRLPHWRCTGREKDCSPTWSKGASYRGA